MAKRRSPLQRHLDRRGPGKWPCPCCGYRTLHEGPGDYDLCPVCFWEDAGDQLRWPTLNDGPNGISLIEGQHNFAEIGACHVGHLDQVRTPGRGEEREPDWRLVDPAVDDFESGPNDSRNLPWPSASEELYWWRPTYFRRPGNQRPGPAPRQPPSDPAEKMMARILEVAPETEAIDIKMRSRWEAPAPLPFCRKLAPFVAEAARQGNTDLALRIINELNAGLTSGDGFAANCVCVGFLEPEFEWSDKADEWPPTEKPGLRSQEMAAFVESWPPEIRAELQRQIAHQEKMQRKQERFRGPQQPGGSWKVPIRWRLRHPLMWRKMRRGDTFAG
jgi:Cysteine-rich CPCC